MNEIEFIRTQVATERRHVEAVSSACAAAIDAMGRARPAEKAALEEFCETCAEYLVYVMARFRARDQVHYQLLYARLSPGNQEDRTLLLHLEKTLGAGRTGLLKLETALGERRRNRISARDLAAVCQEYIGHLQETMGMRRDRIQSLFDRYYGVEEWRHSALVDADSILDERSRYARVQGKLPPGIRLASSDRPDR
jgi:hypothetical protein